MKLELSKLMLSYTIKGGNLHQLFPNVKGHCQVHFALHARLGVLGSLLVDIWLKLHSVHFLVKFCSALAAHQL